MGRKSTFKSFEFSRALSVDHRYRQSAAHTSYVKKLRMLFPLLALIILGFIGFWGGIQHFFEQRIEGIPSYAKRTIMQNEIVNPYLLSTDEKGNPVKVRAHRALQAHQNNTHLEKPSNELVTDKGQVITLESEKGFFDQEHQVLTYHRNVNVKTSDGYDLQTEEVTVNLDKQVASGDLPVSGKGPGGDIQAEKGFIFNKATQTIYFKGPTQLILPPQETK